MIADQAVQGLGKAMYCFRTSGAWALWGAAAMRFWVEQNGGEDAGRSLGHSREFEKERRVGTMKRRGDA